MKTKDILSILALISLVACGAPSNDATQSGTSPLAINCPDVIYTASPMPIFLEWVHPVGNIAKSEYDESLEDSEGILATISALGLDESISESSGEDRATKMLDRVILLVDESPVPGGPTTLGDGLMPSGPFYFSWSVKLDLGYHTAKLVFNTDTGEMISYGWSFCILP